MTVVYETERLVVREWTDDEVDRVYDIYSRWEVARYLGANPAVMESPDRAARGIGRWHELYVSTQGRFGAWAIQPKAGGPAAGTVLFKLLPNGDGDVEVGWHLHPDSWGHGYATEAAEGAVQRGFAGGLTEVYAVVYPENTASLAVCRRLGMTPLGRTTRWYGVECEAFHRSAPPVRGE